MNRKLYSTIIRLCPTLVLVIFFIGSALAQDLPQQGLLPVHYFSQKEYDALAQNWDVTQDKRGIMYFANNNTVLEYDGVNWRKIPVTDGANVRSIDVDANGRIYLGAQNEFGYLASDSIGQMDYVSLSSRLDAENATFDFIWGTHVTNQGVIFQAADYIFIYHGDSLRILYPETSYHKAFYIKGEYYTRQVGIGLTRLENDQQILVPGCGIFADINIFGMIPVSNGRIVIVTESDGLYMMDPGNEGGTINRLITNIEDILLQVELYNAVKIDENRISLGTWGNGVIVVDTLWNLVTLLDKYSGLQDQIVTEQFVDRSGNLWLTLSNGISRVEINSQLSYYSDQAGILGAVQSISRFNNTIYVATLRGLYYLDKDAVNDRLSGINTPVFKVVPGLEETECWDIITFRYNQEELLLVVLNDNIAQIDLKNQWSYVLEEIPWTLYQSKLDPARVYVGLENGLASIYREDNKWKIEGRIEGIDEEIRQLSEDFIGNLWLGTPNYVVVKVNILSFDDENKIEGIRVTRYDSTQGLPDGPFIFSQARGPLMIATDKGLYKYMAHLNMFKPDSTFGDQFGDGSRWIHRIVGEPETDIWMVTARGGHKPYEVGYLKELGPTDYEWIEYPFRKISEELIHSVYFDFDGVVWLGGDEGLYRYDNTVNKDFEVTYSAMIRNISLSRGDIIFGGTYFDEAGISSLEQPAVLKPSLPYSKNSLVFIYAAQSGADESYLEFSYFLEGNDDGWSAWTNESKKEYTNLHEGEYVFRVKARNMYGKESIEATYTFTILAPWYRKWWAYVLYVILATFIVYFIVKIYTRQLREIIRERTAEVVRQKDELEVQKEEIEEKNEDIMASIKYAQKIQTALLPPEESLADLELDGFVLFLPRDIVSGDFYWLGQKNGKPITVAADCTGHGVPGAFMSMLGLSILNNIVIERDEVSASEILDELRRQVITHLRQKGEEGEQKDGMDLALHIIDKKNMKIEFAGANNPLILIRNDELIQIRGDRMPIGIHVLSDQPFENNEMEIQKDDVFYIFSDGFQDQFGGPKGKKFMIKNMKDLFLEIYRKPMEEQKKILYDTLIDWMKVGKTEQVDDVVLIGVRI
ncbi:MAG: SpoIIE family protein phosphatase [Bacteroidales bacterium]|nr:SpoIIE family protein phosphatase [Bacteroidales bacterium]